MAKTKTIRVPLVRWALGDPEQGTSSGVTQVRRPLYFQPDRNSPRVRMAEINPDYAEPLMAALLRDRAR